MFVNRRCVFVCQCACALAFLGQACSSPETPVDASSDVAISHNDVEYSEPSLKNDVALLPIDAANDTDVSSPSRAEYAAFPLSEGTLEGVEVLDFGEPVVVANVVVEGHMDEVVVLDTATGRIHRRETRFPARVIFQDDESGTFVLAFYRMDFSIDFVRWERSADTLEPVATRRHTLPLAPSPQVFPSGFAYTYDLGRDILEVINLRTGESIREVDEGSIVGQRYDKQTGRLIFETTMFDGTRTLFAYDPRTDELHAISEAQSHVPYGFLANGDILYELGFSDEPGVYRWSFAEPHPQLLWARAWLGTVNGAWEPELTVLGAVHRGSLNRAIVWLRSGITGETLMAQAQVAAQTLEFSGDRQLVVYEQYTDWRTPRVVVWQANFGQSSIVADEAMDGSPTFGSHAPAVAVPLESGKTALWYRGLRTAIEVDAVRDAPLFSDPSGTFWLYSRPRADGGSDIVGTDVQTGETMTLAANAALSTGDCAPQVAPGGAEVFFTATSSQEQHATARLWRRSTLEVETLVERVATESPCVMTSANHQSRRGVVRSMPDEGTLGAWESGQTFHILSNGDVAALFTSDDLESVYYAHHLGDAAPRDYVFERWDFETRRSIRLDERLDSGNVLHSGGVFAYLKRSEACVDGCPAELTIHQPETINEPVETGLPATRLVSVDETLVFYRGTNPETGAPDHLMVAAPAAEP